LGTESKKINRLDRFTVASVSANQAPSSAKLEFSDTSPPLQGESAPSSKLPFSNDELMTGIALAEPMLNIANNE
jgi:hypothetical protein